MNSEPNFRGHVLTFVVAVGVAAAFFFTFLGIGGGLPAGDGGYEVRAVVPTAASLAPEARVTMAGLEVGRVTSIERRGAGAVVTLLLEDEGVTPIPKDSLMRLRARTAVGENYISIDRGRSAQMLEEGGTLPLEQPDAYVDVDEILSVFQGEKRDRARELIRGLGEGVRGRGTELNAVLRGTAEVTDGGAKLVDVLGRDRRELSLLVEQLGSLGATLGERGQDIRTASRDGLTTVRALADRDDALRRLLVRLPSTLTEVRATTETLRPVTRTATPVLADLATALRELRPSVRRLRPAAQRGRELVRELDLAAPKAASVLRALRRTAVPAASALPAVDRALCETGPLVRYLEPYMPDVIQTLVGLGSAANSYDSIGHLIRLSGVVDENTAVGLPADVSIAQQRLLRQGLLSEAAGPLNWNPYPPPGSVGKTTAKGKTITGPADLARSGYKYPRILADC